MSTPRFPVPGADTGDLGIVDRVRKSGGIEIPRHGSIGTRPDGTPVRVFVGANAVCVMAGIGTA